MTNCKLVPFDPTPEMVEAAEDAYMPFGDMDLALRMAILVAPDVQVEPVYLYRRLGLSDFVTCDFARYTELSGMPNLFETKILYTAPQPAEQQPDVALLVEALGCILSMEDETQIVDVMDPKAREMVEIARDALAAYRKGG